MRLDGVRTDCINAAIRCERDGDVAIAVFTNPDKLNPLTEELLRGLSDLLHQVHADPTLRALVLTGEGKAFCVGADLTGFGPVAGDPRSLGNRTADTMETLSNRVIMQLQALPVPVIGAINGPTAGAGVGLALAADVTIAARSAYFYLPFVPRMGIVPDLGTTWFLEHRIGRARAVALTMLGDRLPAEQAAQWGLIWACVDDTKLRDEARALAARLARLPAHATTETRGAFAAAAGNSLQAQLAYEAARQRVLIDRPEFSEGVRAFIERRDPVFPRRRDGDPYEPPSEARPIPR
jgi:2-(1,2-epoxy-1,2-dihydrophenyl)acetyl-CoA isomerase